MRIHINILYLKEEKNKEKVKKVQSNKTSITNIKIVNEKMNTGI
jgi:hypothetical protein